MKKLLRAAMVAVIVWSGFAGFAEASELDDAIVAKDNAKVREILKTKPQLVNPPKGARSIPIHTAALIQNVEAIELLIGAGANVNAALPRGERALDCAATGIPYEGQEKAVELLAKAGADINGGDFPVLLLAVMNDNKPLVKVLRKNGARLDVRSKTGATVLGVAAGAGNLDLVKEIVAEGKNVNPAPGDDLPALYKAAAGGHMDVVKYLLEKGARIDVKSDVGTLLFWVVQSNPDNTLEMVQFLIANKADAKGGAAKGWRTALDSAAGQGDVRVVRALVEAGADVNAVGKDGEQWTPLIAAARLGRTDVVKYLLEKGADPSKTDRYNRTPLDHAMKPESKTPKTQETAKLLQATPGAQAKPTGKADAPGSDKVAAEVGAKVMALMKTEKPEPIAIPSAQATPERFSSLAYRYYCQSLQLEPGLLEHMYTRNERDMQWIMARTFATATEKVLTDEVALAFPGDDGVAKAKALEVKKTKGEIVAALAGATLKINGSAAVFTPDPKARVEAMSSGKLNPVTFILVGEAWKIDVQKTSNTVGPSFEKDLEMLQRLARARVMTIGDVRAGRVPSPDKVKEYVRANAMALSMMTPAPAASQPSAVKPREAKP
jgi:ankyrin repeat protein